MTELGPEDIPEPSRPKHVCVCTNQSLTRANSFVRCLKAGEFAKSALLRGVVA